MKTVTAGYVDTLKAPSTPFVRQIWYKRRYWVESSKAYTWESSWTQLTEDKVASCSQITWQLDIQTLNQFQTSNITLNLENLRNQWRSDNPYGQFVKDAVSPVYGYNPFWTKFQVRAGLIRSADVTTEVVPVFTGVATEYNFDSASGTVQVTVSGEENLLVNANAEAVSTTVTRETLTGAVDGSNKIFTTANNGVGIVTEVSDNGLTKRPGTDYTISNINTNGTPATITFIAAPTAGHTIRGSYLYWKASQKFEDLVTALLNQSGIPGGSQNVSPVSFPSSVINTHVYQTQTDWQGGLSLTNIDTVLFANSIHLDFTQDAQSALPSLTSFTGWSKTITGSGHWNWVGGTDNHQLNAGALPSGTNDAWWVHANNAAAGVYTVNFTFSTSTDHADTFWGHFMFNTYGGIGSTNFYNGYALKIARSTSPTVLTLTLVRNDSSTIGVDVSLGSTTVAYSQVATFKIVRSPNGYFRVMDSGLTTTYITATDTTYTSGQYCGMHIALGSTNSGVSSTTDIASPHVPGTTLSGTWIANGLDFSATPSAWTQVQQTNTFNGTSIVTSTAASADNITYDSYVIVSALGINGSTLRRYLRTKIVLTATLLNNDDPTVSSLTVGSVTSSTTVSLANFTGMTCYDAITALGKFANYEFGFGPDETFYFRPKAVLKTPVISIDQTLFNVQIDQMVNGYDRVYSAVRATYAGYIKDIVDDGATYSGPLSIQGFIRIAIDGGAILISADADVATGVVGSFFNYFKYPRRRVKVTTKMLAQIDLSDVVQVTLADNLLKGWYIGDTSVTLGDSSLALYGGEEQVIYGLIMKVIGVRLDTDNWLTQFDLEEVI